MKPIHTPRINLRYWSAIALASVFGTNMGDFYAHKSGLGIGAGLAVLAALTAVVFVVERLENLRHALYYWLVIVIIRTGATNIADFLAYRVRIPAVELTLGLAALIALFGWLGSRNKQAVQGLPQTNASYWLAMLGAGVFGTAVGDMIEHGFGEGVAAVALLVLYVAMLGFFRNRAAQLVAVYWVTVVIARTAGTAIGDWVADTDVIHVGLSLATLLSGLAFAAIVLIWRSDDKATPAFSGI
jgi:uncharacterized membrane-anchored protein